MEVFKITYLTNDERGAPNKQKSKRILKELTLFESAYELFGSKGVSNTSIDDIVKKAGVAKGTFYLYFKSKYDIVDRIVLRKSFSLINEALNVTTSKHFDTLQENVIFLVDYIIEYFKDNKTLLKIIHKNLSWGIFRRAIANKEQDEEMKGMLSVLKQIMLKERFNELDFEKNIFMIFELTGSVCYSSIILDEPEPIDAMKPAFFRMIVKMISK